MSAHDDTRPRRLLLVEDDVLFARSLEAVLAQASFEVEVLPAGDTENFIERVRASDAVVLDLALPGRSGFELLRDIRDSPKTSEVPVLMLTAHDPMSYRLAGLSMGADDFMVKPPDHRELVLRLQALLRRSAHMSATHTLTRPGSLHEYTVAERDIVCVQAARNHTRVFLPETCAMATLSITDLEDALGASFVRVHRSRIVNADHVIGQRWLNKSDLVLEMDGGQAPDVPVSRTLTGHVRQVIADKRRHAPSSP
jgi:DNA-binding response OmpR family regulator